MGVDGVADLGPVRRVVAVSDVHGYRDRFESALLTLADHPDAAPLVERDGDGLRWVDDEAVLVVAGDVVNRGPDSPGCLALLADLQRQAPPGRVRHLAGNHDLAIPYPTPPEWRQFWADDVDDGRRRAFWERVLDDRTAVAFEGLRHTYSHAGAPDGVDAVAVNDRFRRLADRLVDRVGDDDERAVFDRAVAEVTPELDWPDVDSAAELRETADAGVVWLDFSFLRADSPPQVVGHTTQDAVVRRGNVVCVDTILHNSAAPGGEAVVVETRDGLRALTRGPDGTVTARDV